MLHVMCSRSPEAGILNQIGFEVLAAEAEGIPVDSVIFDDARHLEECSRTGGMVRALAKKSKPGKILASFIHKVSFYFWLRQVAVNYEVIILRYAVYDPFQPLYIVLSPIPVFTIHHAKEIDEIKLAKYSRLKIWCERLFGYLSLRACHGIIGVTEEIVEYEVGRMGGGKARTFLYPNGIFIERSNRSPHFEKKTPQLIFVCSNFSPWQGLDLLLESVRRSDKMFDLHLVGRMSESQILESSRDPRVIIHGECAPKDIQNLYEECWVGLSSFALYRQGLSQACSLKVREYLCAGLPVYSGHQDIFPKQFKYYETGGPNIDEIVSFAVTHRDVKRGDVRREARRFIDKRKLLSQLYKDIYDFLGSSTLGS